MMSIENIREFRSVGSVVGASKRFFFLRTVCMPLASGQSGRTRGLQTERSFSMIIGVRAGGGGTRGAAAPPNFGQLGFFGQREKIWAKPVF